MGHEIESMFFIGKTPWHGLGRYVGDTPVTAQEAIIAAGLDWNVDLEQMYAVKLGGEIQNTFEEVKDHYLIRRQDNLDQLGIVGQRYKPIQNKEAFSFLDSLVENGSLRYHTAGSLREGKKVWILGKIGEFEVLPNDVVEKYIFLFASHDGSSAVRILPTGTRVVCMNTAKVALQEGKEAGIKIRHTGDIATKKTEAQDVLGLAQREFLKYETFTKHLVSKQINSKRIKEFAEYLFPNPVEDKPITLKKRLEQQQTIFKLFESGRGTDIKGVSGTGWGAYNAVTEYVNYNSIVREKNPTERRFENIIFDNSKLIQKATNFLKAA